MTTWLAAASSVVAALAGCWMLPAAGAAQAPPPDPADTVTVGANVDGVLSFGTGLGGECTPAKGGCSLFGRGAGNPALYASPIEGKVVEAEVASQGVDEFAAALQIGQVLQDGRLLALETTRLDPVPASGADKVITTDLDLPPLDAIKIFRGQLVGLSAVGETGPSLLSGPGASTFAFIPALANGEARATNPATTAPDVLVPLRATIEPTSDVWVRTTVFPRWPGFRVGARARWVTVLSAGGPVPARAVGFLRGAPFGACRPSCGGTIPRLEPGAPQAVVSTVRLQKKGKATFSVRRLTALTLEPGATRQRQRIARRNNSDKHRIQVAAAKKKKDDDDDRGKQPPPPCKRALLGTEQADSLRGTRRDEVIAALGGDDRVRGRGGGDCISGDEGDDELDGNGGSDVVVGGDGDDRVDPGKGRDYVDGGKDKDRIDVKDGDRDVVDCGPGRDRVKADRSDDLARDCERVRA